MRNDTSAMSRRSHHDTDGRRSRSDSTSITAIALSFRLSAMILPNLVGHANDLRQLADGMDADDVRTGEDGSGHRGSGRPVAQRRGDLATERAGQERFPR